MFLKKEKINIEISTSFCKLYWNKYLEISQKSTESCFISDNQKDTFSLAKL